MDIATPCSIFDEVTATRANTGYSAPSYSMPWLYTAANWDGTVVVKFQVVLAMTAGGGTAYASLYTTGGTAVTGGELSTTSATPVVLETADIKANLTDGTQYHVRIKSSSGTVTCTIYAARIVVYQSGTITKCESYCNISSNGTTTGTSYGDHANTGLWRYTSSAWDGATFYFEGFISPSNSANTSYAQLVENGGSAVSGSEVTLTGTTTDTRVRSSSLTLTDGTDYKVQHKVSAATGRTRAARMVVVQSSFTKSEKYYGTAGVRTVTATTDTALNVPFVWDDAFWSGVTLTVYLEATVLSPSSQTIYVYADDGTNNDATVSSTTSGSKTRPRSSSFTPDDGATYDLQSKVTSGTGAFYCGFVLVQVVVASGGSTYEDSLSLGRSLGATDLANLVVGGAVTLSRSIGTSDSNTAVLGAGLTLARLEGITNVANTVIFQVMTLARTLGVTDSNNIIFGAVLSLVRSLGTTGAGGLVMGEAVSLGVTLGAVDVGGLALGEAVSLGRSVGVTASNVITKEVALSIARYLGVTDAASLDAVAAIILARSEGVSDSAIMQMVAAVALGRSEGFATNTTLQAMAAVALARSLGVSGAGGLSFDMAITLAKALGLSDESTSFLIQAFVTLNSRGMGSGGSIPQDLSLNVKPDLGTLTSEED